MRPGSNERQEGTIVPPKFSPTYKFANHLFPYGRAIDRHTVATHAPDQEPLFKSFPDPCAIETSYPP